MASRREITRWSGFGNAIVDTPQLLLSPELPPSMVRRMGNNFVIHYSADGPANRYQGHRE